jgi:predicted acylesterase/phospholipase RssA
MSNSDVPYPLDFVLTVRTLGVDGEFETVSSPQLAHHLESRLGARPLSILALSGGGANGAFGAGALVGADRDGTAMQFTVVTGVSAGALVAPFAFLGPAWYPEMTRIFTGGVTSGLLRSRGLAGLLGPSLYSGKPLRRLIARYVNKAMIAAIAAQADKGRLLLVATTDLSSGEPVIWDLGSIALHGGKDAKTLIRSVLLASASVPGMFPPVVVRFRSYGKTYAETEVDGGVTLPFFIAPAPKDLPRSTLAGSRPTIVRVIVNGMLRGLAPPTRDNAISVFRRSLSVALNYVTQTRLQATVETLHRRGINLEYVAIPASYPLRGTFDFSPQAQRSLFEYAAHCAAAKRLWTGAATGFDADMNTALPVVAEARCPAGKVSFEQLAALRH